MNRRLTRSRDAMVGGVAAGVANWIGTDPALVRIAWALLVPLTARRCAARLHRGLDRRSGGAAPPGGGGTVAGEPAPMPTRPRP